VSRVHGGDRMTYSRFSLGRSWRHLVVAGIFLGAVTGAPAAASAQTAATPEIGPAFTSGPVLGRLSAAWWQYVIQHLDTFDTVDCASSGTRGITFLFGTMGTGPVTRSCTVRLGTLLFFPLTTQVAIDSPPVFGDGSMRDLHTCAADLAVPASSLHLSVDGRSVESRLLFGLRAASPTFSVNLGGVFPAASDGYWALVPALLPGRQSLKFGGAVPARTSSVANCGPVSPVVQNITYDLTVSDR
jgi:hypothetical protein